MIAFYGGYAALRRTARPQVICESLGGIDWISERMDRSPIDILGGLIAADRGARTLPTAIAFREVRDEYTKRGALGHGRFPVDLDTAGAKEYDNRVDLWLALVKRTFSETATQFTKSVASLVADQLEVQLATDYDDLLAAKSTFTAGSKSRTDVLDASRERGKLRVAQELSILVLQHDRTRVPLTEQLAAPRYAAPAAAWAKAHELMNAEPPDTGNAAKEAVAAVEQLSRILIRDSSATLGDAIKEFRKVGRPPAPTLKGLEELWALSSTTPSVRHGAQVDPVDSAMSRYMLDLSEAALRLLLATDAA